MNLTPLEWIFVVVIIAFVAVVIWWKFKDELLFLVSKSEAEGVITNWMAATHQGKRVYFPMIEFETQNNARITFRAEEMCEGEPMYAPGSKVKIFYSAKNPEIRKVVYPTK
jgi:hypothetical protein